MSNSTINSYNLMQLGAALEHARKIVHSMEMLQASEEDIQKAYFSALDSVKSRYPEVFGTDETRETLPIPRNDDPDNEYSFYVKYTFRPAEGSGNSAKDIAENYRDKVLFDKSTITAHPSTIEEA